MSLFTRRRFFTLAGLVGAGRLTTPSSVRAARSAPVSTTPQATNAYQRLGVRPLINGRGTFTIIGGSIELEEVRAAKSAANQQYVHLDELMDAVGRRLAELTGAEWGMVSAGCAAAMSHATAACVAGGNPDLHVRIPNLAGFTKDEVIIPGHSRNVYDAAIRAVGVRVVEVDTPEELRKAMGPRTAMIYIFAGPRTETGPMSTEAICTMASELGIPVFVDAAAEGLTIPNVHLQRGATLVAYSGGKYIRGPQSAGLLLGRKDLVQAAWVHSAPHHGYARSMKVGREEIVGMLVAVESWVARNHDAEWKQWVARCDHIADRVSKVPGVIASVQREPGADLSNRSPRVTIRWDSRALGITGAAVADLLDKTDPRIAVGGSGRADPGQNTPADTGISIVASMMAPGDEKIVARRISGVLSARHTPGTLEPPAPVTDLSGRWAIDIQYVAGRTTHFVMLQQNGNRLEGTHQGDFVLRDISGTASRDAVSMTSIVTERHGDALTYRFTGRVAGETLSGVLDLGEYRTASWTGRRVSAG
jgi:L-seryl-tRNA(Ser) seleniumtransferase